MFKRDFEKESILKDPIQKQLYGLQYNLYGMLSSMTIVAGPDLKRHLSDARRIGPARTDSSILHVVEIDDSRHMKQREDLETIKHSERPEVWFTSMAPALNQPFGVARTLDYNVVLEHKDIAEATVTRSIDCDLMRTYKEAGWPTARALRRQIEKYGADTKRRKAFIFTFSIRGAGEEATLDWISSELLGLLGTHFRKTYGDALAKSTITLDPRTRISSKGFKGIGAWGYEYLDLIDKGRLAFANDDYHSGYHLILYNDDGGPMLTGLIVYE